MLDHLQSSNLFIVPLDEGRQWFRYHHLFSDLLRDRLRRTMPDLVPVLHQRASDWYQAEGLTAEAIQHALAARDYQRAADLIESVAVPLISQGRISGPQGWLEKLPEDVILSRPWLCIGLANVRSARGQLAAVQPLVEAVESHLSRAGPERPGDAACGPAHPKPPDLSPHPARSWPGARSMRPSASAARPSSSRRTTSRRCAAWWCSCWDWPSG